MPAEKKADHHWQTLAMQVSGARSIGHVETIQSLWSGYGEILRVQLPDGSISSLIVKHIAPPTQQSHPRGWHSDFGQQRKLRSYKIECNWYRHWSTQCDDGCRVPQCFVTHQQGDERWLLLEDLNAAGFNQRFESLNVEGAELCLHWLAQFHATFMKVTAADLWPCGSYWHLDTRPDELAAMQAGPLRDNANAIDELLKNCRFKTLIHGDAKVANFCFANNAVAAVDFQYVGGGCGMKDVAYFIGSCLSEAECEAHAPELLERYFTHLRNALAAKGQLDQNEINALEVEWRAMYAVAWTDFYRFLLGWMPEHRKIHRYTKHLAEVALQQLP